MTRVRSFSTFAVATAMVLLLAGCGGASSDPVLEGAGPSAASIQEDASNQEQASSALEESHTPAGWVGGEATTGLEWPAEWPEQFPRVGGEIIAANSDPVGGNFSVVMYVNEGVPAELISVLKAQRLDVITDEVDGDTDMAAFEDRAWRVDVVGVIQDGTDLPHLRYLVQTKR